MEVGWKPWNQVFLTYTGPLSNRYPTTSLGLSQYTSCNLHFHVRFVPHYLSIIMCFFSNIYIIFRTYKIF